MDSIQYAATLAGGAIIAGFFVYLAFSRRANPKEKWFLEKRASGHNPSKTKGVISGECAFCGKKEALPFRCKFCNSLNCSTHRLPESHNCPGLSSFRRGV